MNKSMSWPLRALHWTLWLAQQREFWLGATYVWLYGFTAFLLYVGLGGFEHQDWATTITVIMPCTVGGGHFALWAFRWAVDRELMLWQAMLLYLAPLTLAVLVIGYQVNGSLAFLLSIFGFCVFWPLTRWFHDTIPE